MDFRTLSTSLDDGLLTIQFNRPSKKNAMSLEMMLELTRALNEAAKNENVVFVILTGSGDFYCSGADMSLDSGLSITSERTNSEDRFTIGSEMVSSFIDFPKLLIAVVNGPAIGIAFTTLALCDIVYCSKEAFFLAPFTAHGLSAEGCSSYLFPQLMGNIKATEVLQLGKKLSAKEAKEYNLVTEIYNVDEFEKVIVPKIRDLKNSHSIESIKSNKRLFRSWQSDLLHKVNIAEWEELKCRFESPDFLNAVMKFVTRKKETLHKL